LNKNEPATPPSSLLSLNYHIVEERHSTDDHVVLVGNDVAKDNDIHEVRKGKTSTTRRQSSMFSSNIERYYFENDRNIDDIDRFNDIFGGGVDEFTKDDSNDNVDKCKVDKLRPQSSFFIYDQIYNDDDSIKLLFADDDPKDDNNNIDKCKVDKLRPQSSFFHMIKSIVMMAALSLFLLMMIQKMIVMIMLISSKLTN